MAKTTLNRVEIIQALELLGRSALQQGESIELLLIGGACMVLAYDARLSTHDVDAVILSPKDAATVRKLTQDVAHELDWSEDWLNDAAKGYLAGLDITSLLFSAEGIKVWRPSTAQMLAMKLSAWRDDLDVSDAQRLLQELRPLGQAEAWQKIEPYLVPGRELKARYAFLDLWETAYGDN